MYLMLVHHLVTLQHLVLLHLLCPLLLHVLLLLHIMDWSYSSTHFIYMLLSLDLNKFTISICNTF
jgi:hypothetical protein